MTYVAEHASALDQITEAGAAVTFTKVVPGVYDPETDTWTDADDQSVSGSALRVKGDPETYKSLGLVEHEAPTLLFAPDTYGEVPALGATVPFGGETYTVKNVDPVAPDGTPIIVRVVVQR